MFRIKLLVIAAGCFLFYLGFQENKVSSQASTPAQEVDLAQLEKSKELENYFINIGEHEACYPVCIYEYYESTGTSTDAKVTKTYYPIISSSHPFLVEINEFFEANPEAEFMPEDQLPEFDQFRVLVKTDRYKTVGAIPDDWTTSEGVQGLVVNRIEKLAEEEKIYCAIISPKLTSMKY